MVLTVFAFLFALAILIAVHEWGHYRVAVACGVRVERFSLGFGKVLYSWKPKKQHPGQDTEFVISAVPLGGYVKMVGQGEVAPEHFQHMAFDAKPLHQRAAIVAAGPIANLLLAILIYAALSWVGTQQAKAILSAPPTNSLAQKAGLQSGDEVLAVLDEWGMQQHKIRSMEDLRWHVTRAALDQADLTLQIKDTQAAPKTLRLPLSGTQFKQADAQMLAQIGLGIPKTIPVIGEVFKGGAGEKSGLKEGDVVSNINGVPVFELPPVLNAIKASGSSGHAMSMQWQVQRGDELISLIVTPEVVKLGREFVGKLNVQLANRAQTHWVRYGFLEGIGRALEKTWDISMLSLRMMGKMLIGQASLQNLSGPITIADVAGKSASLGWVQYLVFLALISVSLGVLNLLPLPMLDGGHLTFYLWEALTGKAVSDAWQEILQRLGMALLLTMMIVALFNDFNRLFGHFWR